MNTDKLHRDCDSKNIIYWEVHVHWILLSAYSVTLFQILQSGGMDPLKIASQRPARLTGRGGGGGGGGTSLKLPSDLD